MAKSYCFVSWLIDGSGAPVKTDVLLCVEGGLISSIAFANPGELFRSGFEGVDGCALESYPACTLVPGLIDCHVHLSMSGKTDPGLRVRQLAYDFEQNRPLIGQRLEKILALGIMAVRDGGDAGGHALRYSRENPNPFVRVKCAGKGWRAPGRYGKIIGRAPENGATLAESIKAASPPADHVKILNSGINSLNEYGRETPPQFDREELGAAFLQARNLGMKIMVHANGRRPVEFAIDAGCDSIEHGFFMGEENLEKMADRQVVWVPTAYTMKALSCDTSLGAERSGVAGKIFENQLEQMSRARELGVQVACGTDAGSFGVRHGAALFEELKLLNEAGFSIEKIIRCATHAGARLLGLDRELGRLCPGMPANFLVVAGPPANLPGSLAEPMAVYRAGEKIISRK
ncbi:MAG: amidohydrolase family protein [Syntrophobacteraceae bacterium]|nr:amidohydrolase family protein [Syntrophobacteraceae bacterium]